MQKLRSLSTLEGVLTRPELSVILSALRVKTAKKKPVLQIEYPINPRRCRGYQQLRRRKRRFLLVDKDLYIQNACH